MLAALDRALLEAEETGSDFLIKSLSKVHMRLAGVLQKFVAEQVAAIQETRLGTRKRKGVLHFVKVFPVSLSSIEVHRTCSDAHFRSVIDLRRARRSAIGGRSEPSYSKHH